LIEFERILLFLLVLSVLVILHELGHYIVARRNGVHVDEFALGFGPKIFGWRRPQTGTLYSLRLLPIGGYCAMYGEDARASEAAQQREFREHHDEAPQRTADQNFQAKTAWQRLRIIAAGPFANFIIAYVVLLAGALAFGVQSSGTQQVVFQVLPHSPAAIHGLRTGDRIDSVNGTAITSGTEMLNTIHGLLHKHATIDYVAPNGTHHSFSTIVPPCSAPMSPHLGCIGFAAFPAYEHVGVGKALVASVNEYGSVADSVFLSIGLLVTQFHQYSGQITGVIGMGQAATTIQSFGGGPYLQLAATISFALGLFNLLPIPALDGGRIAFLIAELLRGKPVDPEKEGMVHFAGFVVLMMLMVVIAVHDISRIASGQGVF
jgi:regulator of sigma E protease